MTNFEKNVNIINEIFLRTGETAFGVDFDGKISECKVGKCQSCLFQKNACCKEGRAKWLNEEYVKRVTIVHMSKMPPFRIIEAEEKLSSFLPSVCKERWEKETPYFSLAHDWFEMIFDADIPLDKIKKKMYKKLINYYAEIIAECSNTINSLKEEINND